MRIDLLITARKNDAIDQQSDEYCEPPALAAGETVALRGTPSANVGGRDSLIFAGDTQFSAEWKI